MPKFPHHRLDSTGGLGQPEQQFSGGRAYQWMVASGLPAIRYQIAELRQVT